MNSLERSPVGGHLIECKQLGVVVKSQTLFCSYAELYEKLVRLNRQAPTNTVWYLGQKGGVQIEANGD